MDSIHFVCNSRDLAWIISSWSRILMTWRGLRFLLVWFLLRFSMDSYDFGLDTVDFVWSVISGFWDFCDLAWISCLVWDVLRFGVDSVDSGLDFGALALNLVIFGLECGDQLFPVWISMIWRGILFFGEDFGVSPWVMSVVVLISLILYGFRMRSIWFFRIWHGIRLLLVGMLLMWCGSLWLRLGFL